jgi:hypothetical protein
MVFAVAVLLMQIQPVPQVAFVVTPSTSTASSSPDTKDGKKVTGPITAHPETDSTVSDKGAAMTTDKNTPKEPPLSAWNNDSLSDTQKQSFSTIRIPEAQPKPIQFASAETLPSRKVWMALSLVQSGAATFDAYSTRQAIGHGAVEEDPTMRPFAHSLSLYAAIQVGPVLLDLLARHMQRSEHNVFRHTWWMPQSAATAGFLVSGVHNIGVANRR